MATQLQGSDHKPLFTRKMLIRLMIPLVIEQFLLMSVGMADTVMVTTAGEAAVSGVSLVDNINLLLIQVFAALGTGGAVVVSQYLGRKEPENARVAAKQLLYAVTIVSTILMALALLFRHQILSLLFGTIEPEVLDSALNYFIATALAYPFMALYNAGSALFRSMGNSKVSMFNSLLINIINIVVNAILIFGFGMGALGAGIGTLVSRIVAAVLIIVLLQHENCPLRVERLFHPEFHRHIIQRILMIGIPNGLENSLFQMGKLMVLRLITSLDAIALAAAAGTVAVGSAVTANAIAGSIAGVANVPGAAMGLAMITVVGQCVGAREVEQAVRYTRKLLTVAYLSVGTLCIIEFFIAAPLVGMFHLSAETAAMAVTVLQWCAVFTVFFWPLAFTLPNALRASGDAMFTMCVSLFSMFAFRIALSYVLASAWGFDMGLLGVWVAMFIDWIVRAAAFLTRFLRGKWKKINLIG